MRSAPPSSRCSDRIWPVPRASARKHRRAEPACQAARDWPNRQRLASPPPNDAHAPSRMLLAEALGTLLLVATVVGSGIMAERLAGGNGAVALARQHPRHRGDTLRADHRTRADVRRALQPGGQRDFRAAPRTRARDCACLCRDAGHRRHCRHPPRPCHVRRAAHSIFDPRANRRRRNGCPKPSPPSPSSSPS